MPDAGYESQNFKAVLGHNGPNRPGRLLRKDRVKPRIAYLWSSWSQYEACNVDCGWGEQRRTRSCQKTDLKLGAVIEETQKSDLCGGSEIDSLPCQMDDCALCQSIPGQVSPFVFEEYERRIIDEEFYLYGFGDHLKPEDYNPCLLYTSPSPRDGLLSRMPSSA